MDHRTPTDIHKALLYRLQLLCEWLCYCRFNWRVLIRYQTLESDYYICVRQQIGDATPEVIIINLKNNNEVVRRPIKADSALMHWTKQVIALKANQRTLQIFDLGQKLKLQSTAMNEDVVYWKWISSDTLGLVTDTSIYHWSVFGNATSPTKVFERNANLSVSGTA